MTPQDNRPHFWTTLPIALALAYTVMAKSNTTNEIVARILTATVLVFILCNRFCRKGEE